MGRSMLWAGFDKESKQWRDFVEELCVAFRKGYSVVELSRALNHPRARLLYEILREAGAVAKLQRKRQQRYELPDLIGKTLKKVGLSYLQWCNSHNLSPADTEVALAHEPDFTSASSVAAHNALANDWPAMHARLYFLADEAGSDLPGKSPEAGHVRKSLRFVEEYSEITGCYVAYSEGSPDIRGVGETASAARLDHTRRYVMQKSLVKLRLLPPHPAPLFTVQ